MEQLQETLDSAINESLLDVVLSNPISSEPILKIKLRPVSHKGQLSYQAEEFSKTQVFHKNMTREEACAYLENQICHHYKQGQIHTLTASITILTNKKGTITIRKKQIAKPADGPLIPLTHNRKKNYILEEGIPVPFLIDLGVMTPEGKIVQSHYDKFRQINRFLEFIADVLPHLPGGRPIHIIDFGCGKSYLTFALYYYLHILKNYPVQITGLDLKKDVIAHCSRLAEEYGYDGLEFLHGDIANYEGTDTVDMVVTLHACDTATDYALAKAVRWGAKVILSVPCCQHELNGQIQNDILAPVFRYGILKERMAALMTDGLRAELLRTQGYQTQILEFIDMEHTPKNLLIRAVYTGKASGSSEALEQLCQEFHLNPSLKALMEQ